MIRKIIKVTSIAILSLIGLIIIIGLIFINTSPQFGGKHSKADKERYALSGHYENNKFVNLIPTKVMDMSLSNIVGMTKDYIKGNTHKAPQFELPVLDLDSAEVSDFSANRLLWFGHSAFLLQLDGKNILLDPMLGESPAPHPMLGTKRYSENLPIEIEKLPSIDFIILSHDHYDHLDYNSIMKLKDKTDQFLVPLGVGAHLQSWGIPEGAIHEFNWWEETEYKNLQIAFTPSRHFSGRGLNDNSSTMWGSWVLKGKSQNIYFSGDSGYGTHFKEIGEKYGPFDFAMMECGQYNERWSEIHMMPEETAQAAVDVQAKVMMPIHWGAFTLALHDWNDPALRVSKKAKELGMPVTIPKIGESILLDSVEVFDEKWWSFREPQ